MGGFWMTVYTEKYVFTEYTYATKDFYLKSFGFRLPREIEGKEITEISKIIGINIENAKEAEVNYKDGTRIYYKWDPIDDEPVIEIEGEKFIRNWYCRERKEYIHPKYNNIYYVDDKLHVHGTKISDKNRRLFVIEFPTKFPIDNWETLSKHPEKELFPHINPEHIREVKVTKSGIFKIYVNSPTKAFTTTIKKTKKYFIYKNVPFVEGVYDVKVPKTFDGYILDEISTKDLPKPIKLKERKFFVENAAILPAEISYENGAITFKYPEYTIDYYSSDNTLWIYTESEGWVSITGADGYLLLGEFLKQKDPLRYLKLVRGLL